LLNRCRQSHPHPDAFFASATVLAGSSACSAGVQQAVTPQHEAVAALSRLASWLVVRRRGDYVGCIAGPACRCG
jgi:hypothetical protein